MVVGSWKFGNVNLENGSKDQSRAKYVIRYS